MVKLKVGVDNKQQCFSVHKGILCKRVPYFDRMFGASWKEGREGIASFPEDSIEAFDLLLEWIYSAQVR